MKTEEILGAIVNALDVIKTIADTPGVNIIPYAGLVSSAVSAIKAGLVVGINVKPYVEAFAGTFDGDTPTDAEMAELEDKIVELEGLVDAEPPPREDGEPE